MSLWDDRLDFAISKCRSDHSDCGRVIRVSPFFSIAVTTYDRVGFLRDTIQSILNQSDGDFEILVGNDNTERQIAVLFPDFTDPRIKWFDHPKNLGPVGNTNRLLELSEGRYFTTLADDDLFFPNFLEEMRRMIIAHPNSRAFFSEYCPGRDPPEIFERVTTPELVMSGACWIAGYLKKEFLSIGCYGVFEKEFITSIGGVRTLGTEPRFSPYNDNLTAVQAGLVDDVVFLGEPLVFFRLHDNSMSYASSDASAFSSAQVEFISVVENIFDSPDKHRYRKDYMFNLLTWFVTDYFSIVSRAEKFPTRDLIGHYLFFLRKVPDLSEKSKFLGCLNLALVSSVISRWRQKSHSLFHKSRAAL